MVRRKPFQVVWLLSGSMNNVLISAEVRQVCAYFTLKISFRDLITSSSQVQVPGKQSTHRHRHSLCRTGTIFPETSERRDADKKMAELSQKPEWLLQRKQNQFREGRDGLRA